MVQSALIDRFLAHHARFRPVDATFIGIPGSDHRLPPVGPEFAAWERDGLQELSLALDVDPVGGAAWARLDAKLMRAALTHASAELEVWPAARRPSWWTGEAAFGVISLLLPSAPEGAGEALESRIAEIPGFLTAGVAQLAGQPTPKDWIERAKREAAALSRLLTETIRLHPSWSERLEAGCARAAQAVHAFAAGLEGLPDRAPACGRDYLALLMREVHGLPWTPEEALDLAREAFVRLGEQLERAKQRVESATLPPEELPGAYARWHERALAEGGALVTPEVGYGLAFEPLPAWAEEIAASLYFLSYRSPPALAAGGCSVYWTARAPQSLAGVKQIHAVHHGSIGHHTQNARARAAASRLAQIGGTDCASGVAFLSSGTMVEGWACYATELMAEVDGFYDRAEELALLEADRRNAASVIADISLHMGLWSLEQMRAFYVDDAGFPAARVWEETTRNSILPATRLMYFLGTEQIKALRREIGGSPGEFHDALLSYGHVPIAWAGEEMRRAKARG